MVRVQVQLDPSQHRQVKRRAKRLGVSVAEVVRRCIDAGLRGDETATGDDRKRRALAACGRHVDPKGPADVARDHDAALADAYRR